MSRQGAGLCLGMVAIVHMISANLGVNFNEVEILKEHIEQLRAYTQLNSDEPEGWAALGMALQAVDIRVHSGGPMQQEALHAFERALALSAALPPIKLKYNFSDTSAMPELQLAPNTSVSGAGNVDEDDLRINVLFSKGVLEMTMGLVDVSIDTQARTLQMGTHIHTRGLALLYIAKAFRMKSKLLEALHACILSANMGILSALEVLVDIYIEIESLTLMNNATDTFIRIDIESWRQMSTIMETALDKYTSMSTHAEAAGVQVIPDGLYFALFKVYQKQCLCKEVCDCDKAWEYLSKGNAAQIQNHNYVYNEDDAFQHMHMVEQIFKPELFEWFDGVGCHSTAPIFIIGMMRSGSTLVEQILDAHSHIVGIGEESIFNAKLPQIRDNIVDAIVSDDPWHAIRRVVQGYGKSISKEMLQKSMQGNNRTDVRWVVDKMLFNYKVVGFIHMIFPKAVVLHTIRDPMDCLFSCYKLKFYDRGLEWTCSMDTIVQEYMAYIKLMHHWRTVLPNRVVDIMYEDIVYDTESMMRFLVDVVGAEWEDQILEFYETHRVVHTHSMAQVRHRVSSKSVGVWKKYAKYLQPMIDKLRPLLQDAKQKGMLPFPDRMNWELDPTFDYQAHPRTQTLEVHP